MPVSYVRGGIENDVDGRKCGFLNDLFTKGVKFLCHLVNNSCARPLLLLLQVQSNLIKLPLEFIPSARTIGGKRPVRCIGVTGLTKVHPWVTAKALPGKRMQWRSPVFGERVAR